MVTLEQLKQGISVIYKDRPIVGQLCLAQAILESGFPDHISKLASEYSNLFGIKAGGSVTGTHDPDHIDLNTIEYINGVKKQVTQSFVWNLRASDSVLQHRKLMMKNRYARVWDSKTFGEAAEMIIACGYASDIAYTKKLIEVYKKYIF